ncbi:unnamed protein product [Brassica rapa subsp. trilocularis]
MREREVFLGKMWKKAESSPLSLQRYKRLHGPNSNRDSSGLTEAAVERQGRDEISGQKFERKSSEESDSKIVGEEKKEDMSLSNDSSGSNKAATHDKDRDTSPSHEGIKLSL